MEKFGFTYLLMVGAFLVNCDAPVQSKINSDAQNKKAAAVATISTPEVQLAKPASELSELCKQLPEIKLFPDRDPNEHDPIYSAVMSKGKEIMPCLVDEITNEMPMHDPRQAPVWQNYKVGDTAVFLLVRIVGNNDLLTEMLPLASREEWKTNGVYAYFNYVSKTENRRQLQKWWREWLVKNQKR